jgi:cystathionine beta-lyase/cystathionine gamma-synthase
MEFFLHKFTYLKYENNNRQFDRLSMEEFVLTMDGFSRDKEICMKFGDQRDRYEGAVIPPIFGNNLFVYSNFEDLSKAVMDEQHYYVYTRGTNPTVEIVEKKLAALEQGEQCKCFASGMAAICAALLNSVKSGDHVILISNVYFSTVELVKYLDKFQIDHTVVYSTSLKDIEEAILPSTSIIYMESPTDMNFRIVDLEAISRLAKKLDIRTIADNTWATPLFQKPLTKGIDMVIHSVSKYLGGHSDVMGGL